MHFKRLFLSIGFLWGVLSMAHAQSLTASPAPRPVALSAALESEAANAFFRDVENGLLFIDFEKLPVNLKEVMIRDRSGAIQLQEEVFELPVDAIYELDLGELAPGTYRIELHAYTKVYHRTLQID